MCPEEPDSHILVGFAWWQMDVPAFLPVGSALLSLCLPSPSVMPLLHSALPSSLPADSFIPPDTLFPFPCAFLPGADPF